jgi:hypothetical protein
MKSINIKAGLLVLYAATMTCGNVAAQIQTSTKVSSPIIVADRSQMIAGTDLSQTQMDAPMSTYTVQGNHYWITAQWRRDSVGGISHSIHQGALDSPYATTLWTKSTCYKPTGSLYCGSAAGYLFTQVVPSDVVELWIVNLYQPQPVDDGELLAFVHEERAGGTGGTSGNAEGKTRIGLAWSIDHGNTWKYLGRIISPFGDPVQHNIQGAPYIVKDGYFYVYFTDALPAGGLGIAIARASVNDVLTAARAGNLGTLLWKKIYNGQPNTEALGGAASAIAPWGITHTQAAYSTHTGKYYLPLTFLSWETSSGSGQWINSSVKIYESADAINWSASPAIVAADEQGATLRHTGGYQYCSIADQSGQPNAIVGQRFYLYCMKDPIIEAKYGGTASKNFGIYRWNVNLGASIDTFRQSYDFKSTQGPYWRYQRGDGVSILDMLWQTPYWAGTQAFNRIYSDSMHPGTSEMPALTWIAPRAGTVRIEGTARSADPAIGTNGDPNCGNGVAVAVMHNSTPIFNATVAAADTVGKSINTLRTVAAGDGIFFIVAPGADNYCDMTRFDPSVTYQ